MRIMKERHLYRGKRADGGGWATGRPVEASYFEHPDSGHYLLGLFICCHKEPGVEKPVGHGSAWLVMQQGACHRVLPETLGQCTGLRDMNGRLIFEGDAVRVKINAKDWREGVVEWDDCETGFAVGGWNLAGPESTVEIVGNVHDGHAIGAGKEA